MKLSNINLVTSFGSFKDSSIEVQNGFIYKLHLGKEICGIPEGPTLIPGIIDLHGDMIEHVIEPRPGSKFPFDMSIRELDKRHAASGVTTAYVAISFAHYVEKDNDLETFTRDLISEVCRMTPTLAVDTRIHARFELNYPSTKTMLKELINKRQVNLVSLMDHSPGQGQFRDLENYVNYMSTWYNVSPEEAKNEIQSQLKNPKSWETIKDLSELAKTHDLPIASHDDDSAEKVKLMHKQNASISEFPVTLEGAEAAKAHGMWTIMGAPNALRGKSHSGNLSAIEALKAGFLDALASDYYPAALLQAIFALSEKGILAFHEAVNLVSLNPARAAKLIDRGELKENLAANFILIDPKHRDVMMTFRQGQIIYTSNLAKKRLLLQC